MRRERLIRFAHHRQVHVYPINLPSCLTAVSAYAGPNVGSSRKEPQRAQRTSAADAGEPHGVDWLVDSSNLVDFVYVRSNTAVSGSSRKPDRSWWEVCLGTSRQASDTIPRRVLCGLLDLWQSLTIRIAPPFAFDELYLGSSSSRFRYDLDRVYYQPIHRTKLLHGLTLRCNGDMPDKHVSPCDLNSAQDPSPSESPIFSNHSLGVEGRWYVLEYVGRLLCLTRPWRTYLA